MLAHGGSGTATRSPVPTADGVVPPGWKVAENELYFE
jgi:hypothetical protein